MIDLIGAVRDMAIGGAAAQLPEANGTYHAAQDDSTLEKVCAPALRCVRRVRGSEGLRARKPLCGRRGEARQGRCVMGIPGWRPHVTGVVRESWVQTAYTCA